ncbi:MAG: hypothetical protein GY851_36860 [bacterium]|nr:hypothetical protein [bacterium]
MTTRPEALIRVLNRHEATMFAHPNEDVRQWWRGRFLESVGAEAHERGFTGFAVFDADENLVAQGVVDRGGGG